MKRFVFFTVILIFVSALCIAADPVEGFWISYDDKVKDKAMAGWEIYIVGDKLFGKVLSVTGHPQDVKATNCKESYKGFPVSGKVNEMTVVGTPWVFDLTMKRTGEWHRGNVIDPDEGRMYGCEVTFHPRDGKKYMVDTLEMRGKVGPFGRSQYWKKATREEALALR